MTLVITEFNCIRCVVWPDKWIDNAISDCPLKSSQWNGLKILEMMPSFNSRKEKFSDILRLCDWDWSLQCRSWHSKLICAPWPVVHADNCSGWDGVGNVIISSHYSRFLENGLVTRLVSSGSILASTCVTTGSVWVQGSGFYGDGARNIKWTFHWIGSNMIALCGAANSLLWTSTSSVHKNV